MEVCLYSYVPIIGKIRPNSVKENSGFFFKTYFEAHLKVLHEIWNMRIDFHRTNYGVNKFLNYEVRNFNEVAGLLDFHWSRNQFFNRMRSVLSARPMLHSFLDDTVRISIAFVDLLQSLIRRHKKRSLIYVNAENHHAGSIHMNITNSDVEKKT
jgi:hypothetical protein